MERPPWAMTYLTQQMSEMSNETTAPADTGGPKTLMESVQYFSDADRSLARIVEMRWPNGVHCRACGGADVRFKADLEVWQCREKHPRNQFSAKVGTVFEDSSLGFEKWFVAIWSVANCTDGISSYELASAIGVTQKSAWRMLHRIRLAMVAASFDKMDGREADETYVGGKSKASIRYALPELASEYGVEATKSDPKTGLERFETLTKALLRADRDELAKAERRYQNERLTRPKRGCWANWDSRRLGTAPT